MPKDATIEEEAAGTLDSVDLTKMIARRHPEYEENVDHWRLCECAYRGGRQWFDHEDGDGKKNLYKFYKEGDEEYKERKERTHRANHSKRVVDTVNQYLFRQPPVRAKNDELPESVKNFWKNTGGKRKGINRFMKEIERWMSTFGILYVVVDRPNISMTLRGEDPAPYAYPVFPQRVLDVVYDSEGNLTRILIAEDYRDDDGFDSSGEIKIQYRLWTTEEWFVIRETEDDTKSERQEDKKYFVYDNGRHDLGIVPVVPVKETDGSKWSATSLISDIVYMDRTLVNYGSLLDEILYEQTFSQLTIPSENVLPGDREFSAMKAAAKNRMFVYNATSPGAKPEFISPDAAQAELILKACSNLKKEIYAVTGTDNDANQQSQSNGKSYASGKVREFDHSQIENILLDKARALEAAEEQMLEIVIAWMGDADEISPDWVSYPDKYDIRGLAAELAIAEELDELNAPADMIRRQMVQIAKKAFPRLSDTEMKELESIIDTWLPGYEVERNFRQKEIDLKVFVAESQADAMDRNGVLGDQQFGDDDKQDLKREEVDEKDDKKEANKVVRSRKSPRPKKAPAK